MTIATKIYTWIYGKAIGQDSLGNTYFVSKKPGSGGREKRWVLYRKEAEASTIPPEWHGWLHHSADDPPATDCCASAAGKSWIKPHKPNLTGTNSAYFPPGHVLRPAPRAKATGDYEPWTPSS